MMYKSKSTLASLIAGIAVTIGYIVFVLTADVPAADDLEAWARLLLLYIGVSVVAVIVVQIFFNIGFAARLWIRREREDETCEELKRRLEAEMAEDEMERLITLKTSHIGYGITGVGLIAMLAALAFLGASAVVAIHMIIGACLLSTMVSGIMDIRYYEKGVRND